jgi:hypothetical protein
MAYAFFRTCTTDHTQAGSTDSTDFSVSVVFTDTTMKLVGSGGHINNTVSSHGQTVPADLAFYSDSGLTTLLNFEIESYDATAGTVVAWVKIPTLSHTTNVVFYMAYDDASVVTFQGNVTGTWNSAYKAVFHLANGSSISILDSTSNANNATNHGSVGAVSAVAGQIDGGGLWVKTDNQFLSFSGPFGGVTAFAISFWINAAATGGIDAIISKGTPVGFEDFVIGTNGSPLVFFVQNNGAGNTGNVNTSATVLDSTWHHFFLVWDGTTVRSYVDGTADNTGSLSGTLNNSIASTAIGIFEGSLGGGFDGKLDQATFSDATRSADWVTSEFNNQKASQTFLSVGAETPTGGGTSFTLTADAGSYSITGTAVTFPATRKITPVSGVYTITGTAATLTKSGSQNTLTADAGSYTVTGTSATITLVHTPVNYTITAAPGSYLITGSRVRLIWSGAPTTGNFPQCMNIAIMGL